MLDPDLLVCRDESKLLLYPIPFFYGYFLTSGERLKYLQSYRENSH